MGPVWPCVSLPLDRARQAPGGDAPLQPRIHETRLKLCTPPPPPDILSGRQFFTHQPVSKAWEIQPSLEMLVSSVTGVFSDGAIADCRLSPALLVQLGSGQACARAPLLLPPQVSILALPAHSPHSHHVTHCFRGCQPLFPPVPLNQMWPACVRRKKEVQKTFICRVDRTVV